VRTTVDRHTDRHTDARDHNTFCVVYDSRKTQPAKYTVFHKKTWQLTYVNKLNGFLKSFHS